MAEEFDSGDDLFDGVDEEQLLALRTTTNSTNDDSSNQPYGTKRKRSDSKDVSTEARKRDSRHLTLARRLLEDNFGFSAFRHEQEAAVLRVLAGENTLVVFPTGAGKSLCYQIPAIAFPELDADGDDDDGNRSASSGVTIVVSPLIALMKDQVDALKKRGIAADSIDSSKTWEEMQLIHAALQKGHLRILYCAPERLNNESFVASVKDIPGGIRLVAVDEAHCISEWGHSFRPDYLKVARFVREIQARSVICLTATATPRVAQDICEAFDIQESCVFRTSPYRPNLHLYAQTIDSMDLDDRWEALLGFLASHAGPTLIYVAQQEQAESHAQTLNKKGFRAAAFHAGMKTEVKTQVQNDFMASRIPIVCATIAFGMGIDKPDIRNIVHWDLSSTVEEYSQQIGRAGRDGQVSHCMYYLGPSSFYMRENFARGDLPSRHSLGLLLDDILATNAGLAPGDVLTANQYNQSRSFDIRVSPLNILYATLELRYGLIRAVTPEYTTYSFEAMPGYYAIIKNDTSPVGKAIWSEAKKKVKFYQIDLSATSKKLGVNRMDLVKKLTFLDNNGHIKLKASGVVNRYRVLKPLPHTEDELSMLADSLYADMATREKDALRRAGEVMALVTGPKCFALALAEHFGMGLPDGSRRCGHCTHCATGSPVKAPSRPLEPTTWESIQPVLQATDVRDDPRFLARVAFGIKSPRTTALKLDKSPVFRSLADHDFDALVAQFKIACNPAKG